MDEFTQLALKKWWKKPRGSEAVIREEGEQATFEARVHGLHPEVVKLLVAKISDAMARMC